MAESKTATGVTHIMALVAFSNSIHYVIVDFNDASVRMLDVAAYCKHKDQGRGAGRWPQAPPTEGQRQSQTGQHSLTAHEGRRRSFWTQATLLCFQAA
jgi:hypothetical protein